MKKLLLLILVCSCYTIYSQTYKAGTVFSFYSDINPDTLINYTVYPYTYETYGINLFDDSLNDIEFAATGSVSSGGSAAYIKVTSLNPNVYIGFGRWDSAWVIGDSNWNVTKIAKPFNAGDTINTMNTVWENSMFYLTDHSAHMGGIKNVNDWIGADKYLGLKYQNGNNIGYSWIRLECKSGDSCYVKDYSYVLLNTGEIKEVERNGVKIYPNPFHGVFYLNHIDVNSFDISRLKLTDILGKEIKYRCEVKGNELIIEMDNDLPDGFYMLHYFSNENMFSKKLVKSTE